MSDFCYSKTTIDHINTQAELMDRMIHALDVDPVALRRDPGAGWFAARLQCIDCPNVPACRQWLASVEKDNAYQPAEFCPNQPLFNSYASKKTSDL